MNQNGTISMHDMQQIMSWNNKQIERLDTCIHDIIKYQALAQPEAEAVVSEDDGTLTYNELDVLADKLARYLRSLGIGPETLVPLCFEKSMWCIVSMVGVLKAGAAFFPLDHTAPVSRLETLTRNADARVLLCSQKHASLLSSVAEIIIPVDRESIEQSASVAINRELHFATSKNLAYMIYTSGSTGTPKGTLIEHGAFCTGSREHAPALLINSESRVLQFASHTFDASLVEILTALMVGGVVCIPSEASRLDDIEGAISRMRVNLAVLTPSIIGFITPSHIPTLKTLVLAGEAMSQAHLHTWSVDHNLINGYGPSEASVCCSAKSLNPSSLPNNIGYPVACNLWVVDPDDHNILVPLGCVGELLIQGSTLARGYLKDPEKTKASFIDPPNWASDGSSRVYKTGDLVKQAADGSYHFVGRKDNQVKVHGQRVELGEIEHHVNEAQCINHGVVILPAAGPLKGRLVSIVSLSNHPSNRNTDPLALLDGSALEISNVRDMLSSRLPAYMVPSVFIAVGVIPLLASGKLDRKLISKWLEDMNNELYRRVIQINEPPQEHESYPKVPTTEVEIKLRLVWGHVLNLPIEKIETTRSFLSLGGDSISAMQVRSQCLKRDINISVQDILRSKSIVQLAQCTKELETVAEHVEVVEQSFELSPIQSMFFKLPNQGHGHFNQSFFLRVTRRLQKKDLRHAIDTIISRHSMLRARFTKSSAGGWTQRLTNDISGSYRLRSYNIATREEATPAIANSQVSLDIVNGPIFSADLFDLEGEDQLLFMVGHHLVIDLVSWRNILEEIEDLLLHPDSVTFNKPVSFQAWCQMQREHSQQVSLEKVLPSEDHPPGNTEYWGIDEKANTYGGVVIENFELDSKTTSLMLTKCHEALRTETIDILLAALLHSFASVFPDRSVPAIYNEGHGREPSGLQIDLSRTIGWFTIMYPVYVPPLVSNSLVDTVRYVKDLRKKILDNGRPYFATRCLTDAGNAKFGHHWPLELTFNYLGQYQQLERREALLNPVEDLAGESRSAGGIADYGEDTPRFGLFEISAVIVKGKLRFSFSFNRKMQKRDKISQWVSKCHENLVEMARTLSGLTPQPTLGDFPLLRLDYNGLEIITNEKLPDIGIHAISDVQDIYPCSSMQEGLLISQNKDATYYAVQIICELKLQSGTVADGDCLARAWQKVCDRHASLRTVFIDSVTADDGLYDQVVLKKIDPDIVHMNCSSEKYALRVLTARRPLNSSNGQPLHRFTICETADKKILFKLEINHTIMDGSSMSIILRDLGLAYENRLQGSGPLYSDYISFLKSQPVDASIEYWKNYLTDVDPCNFPELNDGIVVEKQLRSVRLDFSRSKFVELKQFCNEHGVTFSNVLHVAWGLTLRCYTGSDQVVFGYLTSGRDAPVPGINEAIGPFINMLVCRMNMAGTNRLGAIIDQVQTDYMESLPHRYVSLAEVQHALKLSGATLFNTCLSYQRLEPKLQPHDSRISFEERVPIYDPTEYTISINIVTSDKDAIMDLDYWTDAISDGQASNIASTFTKSLENIVYHSQHMIERLNFLGDYSWGQIKTWNNNIPETIEKCVHEVIQVQTKLQPTAPAIAAWDADLSYAELDALSTHLASYLIRLGVKPETFVPTCFDKSAWTIVAMIAVLKAGAAAVPLDANHPKSALELRVHDTRAQVVLAAPSRAHIFEDMGPTVISISRDSIEKLDSVDNIAETQVQPSNPCFVIFTSGSTGKPKGVVLEHRAIVTTARATGDAYGFGPESRVLQFAAYTFDNSLAEIFITLMRGGCVCVPSENDRFNNLTEAINRLDVNFMDITPTVANLLHPSEIPKVKGLSLGGEALTRENINTWARAVTLHCCYGPSECSINSVWNGDLLRSSEATNIGKSIGSVSWVVNPLDYNQLVPVGVIGELLIEGPILARGYLNDPEKTSKAFITSPAWGTGDGRRFYVTGDLVRQNSDGSLTYLGRKDTQIKLNGQRIELGEIEHHLKISLPSHAQSAVELIKLGNTKALAAFLCLQSHDALAPDSILLPMTDSMRFTVASIESAAVSSLPIYMVPTVYIPVSKMPMTSSGKLDRLTLRNMCSKLSDNQIVMYRLSRKSGRAPATAMEKTLATFWETVLNLKTGSVDADDNFFRLGGDSIGAMKLITLARSKGISISVAAVFSKPRLSDISNEACFTAIVDQAQSKVEPYSLLKNMDSITQLKNEIASQCQIDIELIADILPCTAIQEGLVALSNKDPGAYVAQNVYNLPSEIDLGRFKAAWNKVVEHEDILRTRVVFIESSGFFQVVVRECIDWRTATNIQELINIDRELPAYNGATLSRYAIVEEDEKPQFVWTAHHALYDGWCIPLLLAKVEACYHDSNAKLNASASYSRFIKYLSTIDESESDNFWRTKLSESSALQFPTLPHPSYKVHATNLCSHISHVSRESGSQITLPSTIRAAWALVVAIYSGSPDDVVFGETLTGRDAPVPGIVDIIGPTLATVPTRVHIDYDHTVGKFLEDVQILSAAAIPYQYAGLQRIKSINGDTRAACNFQNLLAIHHDSKDAEGFWDLRSSGTIGTNFYSYPLTMSCQIIDSRVEIEAHYDQAIISTWQVEKILRQLDFVLELLNCPQNLGQKLSDLNMLNPVDSSAIFAWNHEPLKATNKCVHQLIEQQVCEQPESAIAIHSFDARFTYRQLDELSTRLAHYLLKLNLRSTLIPLFFEKSAWTIIAMLGVLKSGSAFVPLDPKAPITRLRDLIVDTKAVIVLCSTNYEKLCSSFAPASFVVNQTNIDGLPNVPQFPKCWDNLPDCDSQKPAYVIFTSGTTGKPKGTIVQHGAFCSGAAEHAPALHMLSTSRVLQFASYTFDASLLEILTALIIGATIVVPSEEDRMNNITKVINEMNVTWTLLTPSFIQLIQPSQVPTLRTLILGGEAMSQIHISTWADKLELINAYGPSECAVVATVNSKMTLLTDPSNMGYAVGGRAWITDPRDHERLAPVGSIGELIIEGPILAQGYLNNQSKTAEVFIKNPKWSTRPSNFKMYKTGDLCKYAEDGSIIFCGRKDTQVKLHGQRLELGEVEHNLRLDPFVQHAFATIPMNGLSRKRLVAVISLQEHTAYTSPARDFSVILPATSSFYLTGIRERLCDHLPAYMVPSLWVIVQKLPLLPSGKLDRRQIEKWVEDMTSEVYHQISDITEDNNSTGASLIERQLQAIWAKALNLPAEKIPLHQSFLHLGGDSISAMQVMSSCRAQDLGVTVQEIIQSKSIAHLAQCVTLPETSSYEEELVDVPFDLSPIQKLYFECVGDKKNHFNQSVMLRFSRKINHKVIINALNSIVETHSILRARFTTNNAGTWQQTIVSDVQSSYQYETHLTNMKNVNSIIESSQKGIDIQKGPVFAVDLLELQEDEQQLILLVAHHLVIDIVSWQVILQDLEGILESEKPITATSLPFQTWSRLQLEHTQESLPRDIFHPEDVPVADLAYWDMANKANKYGDVIEDSFEIDPDTSLLLLGTCHAALKTDPVDIFLASVMASFKKVFSDRSFAPAIFNEGHGREPWSKSNIDLSHSVGWFTTMCPVYLPPSAEGDTDLVNITRWVKDLRHRIPDKGRPYFAYRLLTEEGTQRFAGHWPMEVTFNYLGRIQHFERSDAFLQPVDGASNAKFDIGLDVPRFALIEISAQVVRGIIQFSFSYNKNMKRQAKIRRWIIECQRSLQDAALRLVSMKPEHTLSEFPLLPLTYSGITKLRDTLIQFGVVSLDDVSEVYPCSPMQQGMLLAQIKAPHLYTYSAVFEASAAAGVAVDAKLLADAWQDVVDRHSTLRTIFIDSIGKTTLMDQVVLKRLVARIAWLESRDGNILESFAEQESISFRDKQPAHRFSFCKLNNGRVFCKLEISHTISDGTSIPILLRDLSQAYENRTFALVESERSDMTAGRQVVDARKRGLITSAPLPPLYSEYIGYLRSKSSAEDLNYWKAYLADVEPCNFPALTDGLKLGKELRSLVLNLGESSELKIFCAKKGVTLSNILQLVWALVLRIYTGSSDISFGYLSSGRDAPIRGLQDLAVGAFINMLTCRMNLKEDLPITQALEQIQTDFVQSIAHQACPLADVQHELQLSGTSLFNTAFTFQRRSSSNETVRRSALEFEFVQADDPSEYDVTVNVEALDAGISIHFGYWTSTLSESQATNMSETFQHILSSIIDPQNSSGTIGEIDFFSQHSRQQVMKWNQTMPAKVDRCIHEIIDEHSANRPFQTPAVDAWDGQLTYRELECVTNRLAARLVHLGVGPEIYVPLCFEKSIYTIISMVAVMKAGGAFVPLDPAHPQGRLKHFTEDVRASLLLCSTMYQEKLSATVEQTLVIDQALVESLVDMPLSSIVKPHNPAYIIFTSGTTGLPKGTIIEHAAFCTSATEHARAMYMRSDSRVFQFASHTFDASVMEILSTLLAGGCVCVPSDLERMDNIPGAIRRMGVTWALLTPSVANTLTPKAVPSLKVLVTGGEAMSSGHIAKWKGKTCLINAYGPSETSVIASTSTKVDEHGNEVSSDTSVIGHAVGGRNWIVDPQNYNKLIPVGGIGELIVEGHIVARGYLNNKEKTAQAFISNPAWLKTKHRLYRTGDLVRYCSDGTMSFVARKDTQVKLNGQRIELGEIEHQVKTHMPEDSQSAVELVMPNHIATKALAVFFCYPNATPTKDEDGEILTGDEILLPMSKITRRIAKSLDSSLAGVLPAYMIPSFYIPITKMPWTSSGKLDRSRLRNIVANLPKESTGPYRLMNIENKAIASSPTTEMEKKLQKLWESVMNVCNVGIEDNFFRLGGDSVLAMKLVSAARLQHISLSVIEIFRNPKLADMASVCGVYEEEVQTELPPFSLLKTDNIDPIIDEIVDQSKLERDLIQDAYPTSSLQEGLLTLSIRQSGAYVAHNIFQIPTTINVDRFKMAWQKTVDEVDILRTRIVHMESGRFIQVVTKPLPITWRTADNLQSVKTEMLPIHNGAELSQFTIIGEEDSSAQFFIWSIHHGLYDGWSLPMVLSRVQSAYLDSTSSFPTSSYASFIKYISDIDIQTSDEFWRTRLAGASPLQFPQKSTHSDANLTRENQVLNHRITVSDVNRMEVTIPTIIRAAWSLIVATYSGSNDVIFGETLAGRDIPVAGIADIIGPIFTTVPTRIQIDRKSTIGDFLNGIHQMATEIIPYQHAGLQRIKRLDSDTELACDFQNLLVIQTAEEETEDEFWKMENSGVADNFFTYPLVLEVKSSVDSSKIDILAHFDAQIISNWQVQRLIFQFDAVLRQLLFAQQSGATERVGDVQIFSPEDKHLLQECNTKTPILLNSTIHEEFQKIVLARPLAPALCSWDGEFSYKEVYENSTRLAHHLVSLGVGPNIFVPICMDKSAWAIISMLAIMIANGAYSPLDPAAPIARHQEMIEDLDAKIVLCMPKYAASYQSIVNRVVSVDESFVHGLPAAGGYPSRHATGDSSAYAIFTSGSSGKPKGCVIQHRAICTSSIAMRDAMLMKKDSRVFQFASYTFDVSVLEIFTTLTYGGCVCIPSETARLGDIAGTIAMLNVQWSFLTPSVANLFEPSSVPSLEVLVCGGEAMSLENILKWAPHVTLVNGYGPTEASVIALSNNKVSQEGDPTNIGRALAGNNAWIADPSDHNRLAPVGCPGELLLAGPILAREYIKNPKKTKEAFITNPLWLSLFDEKNTSRRLYSTGDLVKYNEDLSISFIGRKDNQVKLNGQRMELGEIENALDINEKIKHALVVLPTSGHFKKRLVAILSLTDVSSQVNTSITCQIIQDGPRGIKARSEIAKARAQVSERLPAFMIPSTWIAVESVPLLPSGKLDRRGVLSWLEKIDEKMYETIMEADNDEDDSTPPTDTSLLLQQIFCRVLNLPLHRVKLSSSFLSVGGDSITAMQVMAMCRKEKINFTLSEVLRSRSIHQLSANAKFEGDRVFEDEKLEEQFGLSPIQQLYFQAKAADQQKPNSRFNQSFTLRISRKVDPDNLKASINTIVDQHSMLRAKFNKGSSGLWQQRITKDTVTSHRFRVHNVDDINVISSIVGNSQATLDIHAGPLFSVDLFNIDGQDQMLFLAAHHLVIDMVSWRIILGDLEELLNTGKLISEKPLSYQVWLTMQADHSQSLAATKRLDVLPFKVGPSRIDYWGMLDRDNTYNDVISNSFTVGRQSTLLAMGSCNTSLRTDPVELFLSAIAHSFSRVFLDRDTPALYNEGHGRESWDSSIDVSRTVGWFTSIFPLQVDVDTEEDDVVDTVRRIKDIRRKVPDNGRPYFAQRFLTPEGRAQFKEHDGTMEVIFNYLGRMQQLEHDDSLFQQWSYPDNEDNEARVADVGPHAERFALFEISASIARDEIHFSFLYNKNMNHQKEIQRWIMECQRTLEETIQKLASMKDEVTFTLSDFPLLPISYDGLEKITAKSLPQVGITPFMVENIYPCAPLQEGLILSQIKDPSLYHFHAVFEVNPASDGIPIDAQKLMRAWQRVVDYHGALRTVFADSVYRGDIFNQIVVKKTDSGAIAIQCNESEALRELSKISILDHNYKKQPRLPHQITICQCSSGKVYFKGEINHGVIDGSSANIMLRDLASAYHGTLPDEPGPSYGNYISHIKTLQHASGNMFWKRYLEGVRPCHFPKLNTEGTEKLLHSAPMDFDRFPELQAMCKKMKVTLANVMQAAWALCLRAYTKSEDICFGYLTSGRDVPVPQIQDTIGAFINMLVCRVKFSQQSTLKEVYQKVQQDYIESLEFQHTSLAQVQHDLTGGQPLFNTAVSIQKGAASDDARDSDTISFDPVAAHDPGEYAITLNVRTYLNDEGMVLRYWTDFISDEQAAILASKMSKVLETFVNKPHQTVEELDLSEGYKPRAILIDQSQRPEEPQQPPSPILNSTEQLRSMISETVREVIAQMFQSGTLVSYGQQNIQDTMNFVNRQIIQPQRLAQIAEPMIDYSQLTPPKANLCIPKPKRTVSAEYVKPALPRDDYVERKLLAIWSDLLQIPEETIRGEDSFFALGGDSIIAMQMVGIARDEDLALTVASIFRHPTFADMVTVIRLTDEANAPLDIISQVDQGGIREARAQKIQNALYQRYSLLEAANVDAFLQENICPKVTTFRGGIIDVFPATDFQALAITGTLMETKWMLNYFHLSGDGPLDLKKLKIGVYRLVDAFDILRTVFVPYGNRFFQVVLRKLQPTFSVYDCDDLAEFTNSLQESDRNSGPRLGESYLKFVVAKERGSLRHRIIIRMSHAQYDGVCMPTILAGLQKGYQSHSIPATPSFSGYVRDAARKTTDEHYAYWKKLLKGSSMTEVVRRHGPNYKRGGEVISLKRNVHLSSLASKAITPASIIKAAWSLVLATIAGSSDITFGNVISGRNAAVLGIENIVGPCVNLVPVRIAFLSGWTVLDLLHHIQDQQVANMPYESLGFREIIKHCTDYPDWTNFSTVCQHQNIERQAQIEIGKNSYTLGAIGSQEDFADITILSTPQEDDSIEISLIFTKSFGITIEFAEELFEELCNTSKAFSENPNAVLPSPSELSALPRQTIEDPTPIVDSSLSDNLRGINHDELLVYNDVVTRAWRQILWDKSGAVAVIDFDSSFYELGGDIIGVAQVASILEAKGFKLRVEDMVDHPLLVEQLALCAVFMKGKREADAKELADLTLLEPEQSVIPKQGLKKVLGKTTGLKNIFKKKGKIVIEDTGAAGA